MLAQKLNLIFIRNKLGHCRVIRVVARERLPVVERIILNSRELGSIKEFAYIEHLDNGPSRPTQRLSGLSS